MIFGARVPIVRPSAKLSNAIPATATIALLSLVRYDSWIIWNDIDIPFKSFYEKGKYAVVIRNNLNVIVLMESSSNRDLNTKVARQIGYQKEFNLAKKVFDKYDHAYVLFHLATKIPRAMRVCTNFFSENSPFCPTFYISKSTRFP